LHVHDKNKLLLKTLVRFVGVNLPGNDSHNQLFTD